LQFDVRVNGDAQTEAPDSKHKYLARSLTREAKILNTRSFSVITSWDDGHIMDLKLVEKLENYGVKGTFFVPSRNRGVIDSEGLDDNALRDLSEMAEIGSHTVTHPDLRKLDDKRALEEMRLSKQELEMILNKEIVGFCYPMGRFDQRVKNLVAQAGYKYARVVDDFSPDILCRGALEVKTTIQANRRHVLSKNTAKRLVRDFTLVKYLRNFKNWDTLAIKTFDQYRKKGGAFHLWGHSWEIEKSAGWDKLERVLDYIGNREATEYLTLQQYVEKNQS